MKLTQYLFRKFMLPIYVIVSAAISIIFILASNAGITAFGRMLPSVLCLILTIRIADDIFDYEKDAQSKTQPLSKNQLIVFGCVCAAVFVLLNTAFYGAIGILSLAAIGYIIIQEKLEILKIAYMALMFIFYFCANCISIGKTQLIVISGCLIISSIYYFIKRKVRK
ncbi:MAG: hypothetical protein IJO29_07420 [Oscillospiraceae bacterium]|nr:hypothetical protein [Oscillospiraceae bacterium]